MLFFRLEMALTTEKLAKWEDPDFYFKSRKLKSQFWGGIQGIRYSYQS